MKKLYALLFSISLFSSQIFAQCPVQIQHTNILCNGQCNATAQAFPSGPSPYTYNWSNSATTQNISGLCAGTYSVIVVDGAGCTGIGTVVITQPLALQSISTGINSTGCTGCNGGAVNTTFGGTSPYTFSWAPSGGTTQNPTGLCPGTYTCYATDANGCTMQSTATVVSLGGNLTVTATNVVPATSPNCNNGSATGIATGGSGNYTYLWSPGGQTTQTATGLSNGPYIVQVTDITSGCIGIYTVLISCITGTNDVSVFKNVEIYPNPSSNVINIKGTDQGSDIKTILVTDISGRKVLEKTIASGVNETQLDVSTFDNGIYFVTISTNDSKGFFKIVKQ